MAPRGTPVQFAGHTPPVLDAISPNNRSIAAGNFTLTANGSNFTPASKISFNGVEVATTFVSSSQLTAAISVAGATAGSKNVMVVTGISNSGIKIFTYSA